MTRPARDMDLPALAPHRARAIGPLADAVRRAEQGQLGASATGRGRQELQTGRRSIGLALRQKPKAVARQLRIGSESERSPLRRIDAKRRRGGPAGWHEGDGQV